MPLYTSFWGKIRLVTRIVQLLICSRGVLRAPFFIHVATPFIARFYSDLTWRYRVFFNGDYFQYFEQYLL